MPPRIQPSRGLGSFLRTRQSHHRQRYATAIGAYTSTPSHDDIFLSARPVLKFPSTQPPSHKLPEFRKTQLLRQYASLLQSTPLMLIFQHNNLKSMEWVGVRRELNKALQKVDEARVAAGQPASENMADGIKLQIMQTGILAAALNIVEFYDPTAAAKVKKSKKAPATFEDGFVHVLSKAAYEATAGKGKKHALSPLLAGPVVLLNFPSVSPAHLKAAFSILSPSKPHYPAPTRRASPGWHDPPVQAGVQKLLLLGARVEGKVFDVEGAKWVGCIPSGLEDLRGQLVAMLQGICGQLTSTMEGTSKSLYLTVEGRRTMLEDEGKEPCVEEVKEEPKT
ncbi:hypothetical protein BJ878DRAFT_130515 [Calycina marina]|uniref:Uncharacterized protein n=1 Tax=Calycina marina TaxID=1763456 RepID=A0A9P7Z092_9HELO|nr:hypothetical protein BJ878DRAFT_130515 [Calycina marina]